MEDERWDLELDVEYQMNARNDRQVIDYRENQTLEAKTIDGMITTVNFPDSPRPGVNTDTVVEKHWQNQISLRVGGTYNIVPGFLALSMGAHYENRGVDPAYMQIDYWPLSRIGLHGGVKVRIARTIDFVVSYAHIFQETLVVGAPPHDTGDNIYARYSATGVVDAIDKSVGAPPRGQLPTVANEVPPPHIDGTAALTENVTKSTAGRPPYVINSGTYRSGIDVVAIGANVHF
jgi:hypothetical protein